MKVPWGKEGAFPPPSSGLPVIQSDGGSRYERARGRGWGNRRSLTAAVKRLNEIDGTIGLSIDGGAAVALTKFQPACRKKQRYLQTPY